MTEAYDGKTGSDYDELLDQLADVCARDEPTTVAASYAHENLQVPQALLS